MATISWISTTGGDWSDGANWQGGVVPGAADDAVMNLSNAETITISSPQLVHDVSFDDPAATFLETASGTLTASGDVTMVGASFILNGDISSVEVSPGTTGAAVLPETGQLVPGVLTAGISPAETFPAAISPLSVTAQPFNLIDAGSILTDGFIPFSQSIITVAPANPTNNSPSLVLTAATVPPATGGSPFLGIGEPPVFLNGDFVPAWGGQELSPRNLASAAQTVFGASGAIVTAAGFRPEVLAAGTGNETLIAGGGHDTCVAGPGTEQMTGGPGSATFLFSNGAAGGAVTIANFVHGQDFVALRNFGSPAVQDALASASVVAGSESITLADNSRITFVNVANLTPGDFR